MLNFQPKKPSRPDGFTLDPVERERAKGHRSQKRPFHLLFMVGVIIATCYLMYDFMDGLRNSLTPVTNRLNQETPLEPMVKPSISTLPALPEAKAIAEHRTAIDPATVPLWIEQPDAPTMAWIQTVLQRDRETPPLPQRVEARDLAMRRVKVGQNLVVSGMLEDSQPAPIAGAAEGYQRLLVGLSDGQYLEVLAPESARELFIGDEVVVVGRYLGFGTLPPAEIQPAVEAASTTTSPADAGVAPTAPAVAPARAATVVQVPLIAARIAAKPAVRREQDNPYIMRGEWKLPDDIYQNVDDDLLVVETRPYYYTLGQVLLDRTSQDQTSAPAGNANEMGTQIHREPAKYRGQVFTVRGRVFHAWEDPGVAQDQPFGITRVVRVIMWSEDWGDWDVYEKNELVTKRKLILRAFEIAAVTHQPLPNPGEMITATGRFLRLRSMEVKPNAERDKRLGINRESGRAHTFLFVTDSFALVPANRQYDFTILGIVFLVGISGLGLALLLMARREERKKEKAFEAVLKFRETRQALALKRKAGTSDAAGTSPAVDGTSPAAPAPTETPPTDPSPPEPKGI